MLEEGGLTAMNGVVRTQYRPVDLLANARMTALKRVDKSGLANACYAECRKRFNLFNILNYIMYTEAVDGFDILEECGLMRQKVKQYRVCCDKMWAKYQKELRSLMREDAWYLNQDYFMAMHETIQTEISNLRDAFTQCLSRDGVQHVDAIAQLAVAINFAGLLEGLWDSYFKTFKRICGLDFTKEFRYADLRGMLFYLRRMADVIPCGQRNLDYSSEITCVDAILAIDARIRDENTFNIAAKQALGYSKAYKPQADELTKQLEQEQ